MYKSIQTIALLVAGLGFVTPALAEDALELKTADREILGTRDVEAGHFTAGIAKLERALQHANHSYDRAPALVNLCVAHAAIGELEKASQYCNDAVATGVDVALAYNNRAVVNCLQGNLESCAGDLNKAGTLQPRNPVVQRNIERIRGKKQVAANL